MAFSNPTFVFVPGAWHPAQCFDLVRAQLEAQGFATEAVSIPSVGIPETGGLERPPGLDADVTAVRDVVSGLADEGRPIVLCAHSYGGLPGPNALGPAPSTDGVNGDPSGKLGFKHRAAAGKPGGVIMLVYLAAVVVPAGRSAYNELGEGYLPWMDVKVSHIVAHPMTDDVFDSVRPGGIRRIRADQDFHAGGHLHSIRSGEIPLP